MLRLLIEGEITSIEPKLFIITYKTFKKIKSDTTTTTKIKSEK